MILLDWEKAFDKTDHTRLVEALTRLGIPPDLLNLIKTIYSNPHFRVTLSDHSSTFRPQNSGIRQGCPLSPYLFVLVMTTMFRDIRSRLNTPAQLSPIKGVHFAEVLYADDTLLFGTHTQSINKLLKEIQIETKYYKHSFN